MGNLVSSFLGLKTHVSFNCFITFVKTTSTILIVFWAFVLFIKKGLSFMKTDQIIIRFMLTLIYSIQFLKPHKMCNAVLVVVHFTVPDADILPFECLQLK